MPFPILSVYYLWCRYRGGRRYRGCGTPPLLCNSSSGLSGAGDERGVDQGGVDQGGVDHEGADQERLRGRGRGGWTSG